MRTTLDLNEQLIDEVVALTGERNKGRAVNHALQAFVRRQRLRQLQELAGHIELVDNLQELEELEVREMSRMQW